MLNAHANGLGVYDAWKIWMCRKYEWETSCVGLLQLGVDELASGDWREGEVLFLL
jgi:hypothetical protein